MKKVLLLTIILGFFVSGCGKFEDKEDPSTSIQVLPVAPDDPRLQILVSYIDTTNSYGQRVPRLKLVTSQEFDNTTGYKFLGRAYSKDFPGRNGFGVPVFEYWAPINSPSHTSNGFKYSFGIECRGLALDKFCPAPENDIKSDAVFYSYALENLPAGIVTLYQFDTVGSVGSGVTGMKAVEFTTDPTEIIGRAAPFGGRIPYQPIGFIFHSTQEDRDKRLR